MSRLRKLFVLPLFVIAVAASQPHGQTLGSPVQADLQLYMQSRIAAFAGLSRFSFGVYSDIHMVESVDWGFTRAQWQGLLRQWRNAGHSFGMVVGDLGYGNATDISNVLAGPAGVPDAPPVLYQMGNHELDGVGKRAWVDALYPGGVSPTSWTPQVGVAPGNADHVYYSFNVGPSTHFIVLDGDVMTYDGVDARARQTFGQKQLAWFKADVQANASKNILVFVHEPIDQQVTGSTPDFLLNDRAALLDVLSVHPKQAVIFSGHFHSHRGVTRWKGVTSVHVMTNTQTAYGQPLSYGVDVAIDGEQITISNAGTVTEFDQHPMNQILLAGSEKTLRVAEDGTSAGISRNATMTVVGPENGVSPTNGSLMLKGPAATWYAPRFISEQLIKIEPGMKFSFDIYLTGVTGGNDAVTVQPGWYMKDGSLPPRVVDQNGIQLSQRPRDGMFFLYNEDVPRLNGLATNQWYHREFDLSALAGHYVDGLYLTQGATRVNVSGVYVDNIKFTWPAAGTPNAPPQVTMTAPTPNSSYTAPASISLAAAASDSDGTISEVSFYVGTTFLGRALSAPYLLSWSGVPAGSYSLSAVATDNRGATRTSTTVPVTVTALVPPPNPTASAAYLGTDTATRGNWKGVYGMDGYTLANDGTSLPAYATLQQSGSASWTFTYSTTDPRALLKAASNDRIAATWYGTTVDAVINLIDGQTHSVSAYFFDLDSRGRALVVEALDAGTGAVLDTRALTDLSGGRYASWNLRGRVILRIRATAGPNAIYSALFFDTPGPQPPAPPPSSSSSAAFRGTDTATRGSWQGMYGAGGYLLANDGSAAPSYAVVKQNGVPSWTWSSWTADVRALQKSASIERIAATWYAATLDLDIDIEDGRPHDVSLYTLDWDNRGRSQTIQVLDADTGALLDTRSVSNFSGGQYWTWAVSGHVIFRITLTGGPNAVYSAIFFGS